MSLVPVSGTEPSRRGVRGRLVADFSILLGSNGVCHCRAARAHGLWPAGGRIVDSLMFGFCVELGSDHDHYSRQPNPKHECDEGTQGAVSLVVAAKIFRVPRK